MAVIRGVVVVVLALVVVAAAASPKCLCAVMLSSTTRNAGIKPEVAITIPKRCNIADRPVGYKCGGKLRSGAAKKTVLVINAW
uniref:Bifunctional inhibitor/plant lipid transfer protein/seed storage helical domain-containing protein n=1 Tax=Oryza barthii TaxID=65489 RepID=A0A0D3FVQ0_9ORYZ